MPRLEEYDKKLDSLAKTLEEIVRMVSSIVLAGGGNSSTEEARETAQDLEELAEGEELDDEELVEMFIEDKN